jgi:hypothetical protein
MLDCPIKAARNVRLAQKVKKSGQALALPKASSSAQPLHVAPLRSIKAVKSATNVPKAE